MALIYCPECGHEISDSAVACPNCGRPINTPHIVERKVVTAAPPPEESGFPKWALIPLVLLAGLVLGLIFYMMTRDDDGANSNLRVNVNTQRPDIERVETGRNQTSSGVTSLPTPEGQAMTIPGEQTGVTTATPTAGEVVIEARVVTRSGQPQPVRNERFYLLDEPLMSILGDADIDPIDGQTLSDSFGLSVLYPDRYSDFNRAAMTAIRSHIKYSGTTDAAGKAAVGGVEPGSYYLFGVTKAGRGFAVWSSPVTVVPGENRLNLTPQQLTEIELSPNQ
jgi:hypothetical protein